LSVFTWVLLNCNTYPQLAKIKILKINQVKTTIMYYYQKLLHKIGISEHKFAIWYVCKMKTIHTGMVYFSAIFEIKKLYDFVTYLQYVIITLLNYIICRSRLESVVE